MTTTEPTGTSKVLVVASADESATIEAALSGLPVEIVRASSASSFAAALDPEIDVVVCGSAMPWTEAVAATHAASSDLPCVAFGPGADIERAFEAGVTDFVAHDAAHAANARLRHVVVREAQRRREATSVAARARLFEQVIDGMPFILFVKDAATRRLIVANQTFADAFGVTKDWLIGKLDSDYFPAEQAESFVQIDTDVLASKQLKIFEETARTDGVDRIYQTRKVPLLDAAGESVHLLGVTEDVTERRIAEEDARRSREMSNKALASYQRRALQMEIIRQQNEDLDRLAADLALAKTAEEERGRELQAAVRLKSEFLANFSHEIRTPLNGILGYCDLVLREEGERLTPHGRRDLNVVKQNARTLLALINDILDLSKIEAGRVEVHKESVEIDSILEECKATLDQMLRGKDVELRLKIASGARRAISDTLKLRQVILNLMTNAAKFTDSGEIVVSAEARGTELVMTFEDTGTGIPEDQLQYIFEKFRQVDGGSTRRVGGTGLGLAIVREVCHLLGGTVDVKSTLGRGSVFTVRLPDVLGAPSEPKPETSAPVSAPASDRPKVLVVDDDPMVAKLLAGHLEKEGFEVFFASDGLQGLARAREHRPQVIVLDLHMPKLDGWGVLARLKADPEFAQIPVIVVSVDEQRARAFSFGACDFLVKPFEPDTLASAVRRSALPGGAPVLVVDDDQSTRELVARSLQLADIQTIEAASGQRALELVAQAQPAMIVLDLIMPGMDGFEVIRTLRSAGNRIPILVLSGKELDAQERDALQTGVARVLTKGGTAIGDVVREAREQVSGVPAKVKKPRLLYVEDSAQNRDLMRRILSSEFDLSEAEDGEEGVARALELVPQLILMDLSLPRLDGWEATRRIKSEPRTARIPVIAMTAHSGDDERERAREVGCDGYLTKPVEREELLATIRAHLKKASAP